MHARQAAVKPDGRISGAYHAGGKHQQTSGDQQVQTEASKQSLVLGNVNHPLHCQLLAPKDKL